LTGLQPRPWACTLHLEVRSRGKPGQSATLEQRIYTAELPGNPKQPDDATLQMVQTTESFGYVQQSVTVLTPTAVDLAARTATFCESRARSDKFIDRLEFFGWVRQS
jgi:hypothetical protein